LAESFKKIIKKQLKKEFPDDAYEQMWGGIHAVFASWMGKRAVAYRKIEGIPEEWGTAVNVQAMVFGNMGDTSATGVAFTRNPATARTSSSASGCPTRRAKTWWPVSAPRCR
jgi:pyruvate,orthophosphate dikinase